MAEQCRLCGASVRVAAAAHVMLNAPEAGVRDYYVCPACYDESVEPLFSRAEGEEAGDGADEDPEGAGNADEDPEGADGAESVDGTADGDVATPE